MTDAATTPLIDGQGIPVELRDVDAELARLWGPAALEVDGLREARHITGVVLANLVLECLDGDAQARTCAGNRGGTIPLPDDRALQVGRRCAKGHSRDLGYCAICRLRGSRRSARSTSCCGQDRTRSIFFLVLCGRSSRPTCRTCSGGRAIPGSIPHSIHELAQTCSRLVLDLGDQCTDAEALRLGLNSSHGTSSHDSVWFGLTRWRELVAAVLRWSWSC